MPAFIIHLPELMARWREEGNSAEDTMQAQRIVILLLYYILYDATTHTTKNMTKANNVVSPHTTRFGPQYGLAAVARPGQVGNAPVVDPGLPGPSSSVGTSTA